MQGGYRGIDMDAVFAWLSDNLEWIFSGIGTYIVGIVVAAIVGMVGLLVYRKNSTSSQKLKSGDNSINIQAGNDVNASIGRKIDDAGQ